MLLARDPISTSRPPLVPIPRVFGDQLGGAPELIPSWPMRNRQSRSTSQLGQDRLSSSPRTATRTYTEEPFGYDALRQNLRNLFKEELNEILPSSLQALHVDDEPTWVDALKRDIQTMFRKELYDMVSSSSNALAVTEEPSWAEALRRDIQTMNVNGFSELLRAMKRNNNEQVLGFDAVAIPSSERRKSAEMMEETSDFHSRHARTLSFQCHESEHHHGTRFTTRRSCGSAVVKTPERIHDEEILADLRCHLASSPESAAPQLHRAGTSGTCGTSADTIKQKFRKSRQKAYDVKFLYHEEGFFQKVAKHELFDYCTLAVIVSNSIWMAIDTDANDADSIRNSKLVFVLADVVFYVYFLGELLIRFFSFKHKSDCRKDGWFIFDSVAVVLYTVDPFAIGIVELALGEGDNGGGLNLPTEFLRLLRLGRLARLTRVLRHMPEMLIIIKGIITALATVGYTLGLLVLVTYVFAIGLRSISPADAKFTKKYFSNVFETMHNLVIHGTFLDDLAGFIIPIKNESLSCFIMSWLFIVLSALLIMNMLIGVVCQVIATVSAQEKERVLTHRVWEHFLNVFKEFDSDEDGLLDWEEFARLLGTDSTARSLRQLDVDVGALVDMVEDIFFYSYGATHGSDVKMTITYTQVIELILQLRGSQPASVKDVMAIGKRLNSKLHELKECLPIIDPLD